MHQRTTIAAALTAALALSTTVFAAPVTTEGTATGRHGDLTVAVTFDGGKIRKIDIVKESENPILAGKVYTEMRDAMVAANSVEVDAVLNQQANTSGSTPAKKAASFEVAYFLM